MSGLGTLKHGSKLARSHLTWLNRITLPLYKSHLEYETWHNHFCPRNAFILILGPNGVTANMTEVDASKLENHNCVEMISYIKIHNSNGLFWCNMQ